MLTVNSEVAAQLPNRVEKGQEENGTKRLRAITATPTERA